MIFQGVDARLFLIFSVNLILIVIYSAFAAMILKRRRNRSTYLIGTFFALVALAFILNVVNTIVKLDPFSYYVYVAAVYCLLFSYSFLVLFMANLLSNEWFKRILIHLAIYSVLSLIASLFPGALQYSESTNWRPIWSLEYYVFLNVLFTIAIVLPHAVLSVKVYKKLRATILKKIFYRVFIGTSITLISVFSAGYYNTFPDNEVFRTVWSVLTFFLSSGAGILIYFGIRKEINK